MSFGKLITVIRSKWGTKYICGRFAAYIYMYNDKVNVNYIFDLIRT